MESGTAPSRKRAQLRKARSSPLANSFGSTSSNRAIVSGTGYPRNGGGHRAFWRGPTAQHNRDGGEYNERDQRYTHSHGGADADHRILYWVGNRGPNGGHLHVTAIG